MLGIILIKIKTKNLKVLSIFYYSLIKVSANLDMQMKNSNEYLTPVSKKK